jgi:hypothetical protein
LRAADFFFAAPLLFFFDAPFLGILAPERRASLNAIATACFRLATFFLPPDFSSPDLYSRITFFTLARPFVAVLFFDALFFEAEADFFVAIGSPPSRSIAFAD